MYWLQLSWKSSKQAVTPTALKAWTWVSLSDVLQKQTQSINNYVLKIQYENQVSFRNDGMNKQILNNWLLEEHYQFCVQEVQKFCGKNQHVKVS